MEQKKIGILGASGLLGGHLIEQGLIQNYRIKAIVRSIPTRSGIYEFKDKIEIIQKDILDLVADDINDIDILINSAAIVSSKDDQSIINDNLTLTKKIIELIKLSRVNKFIHLSSVATMSDGNNETIISETNQGNFRKTKYAQAKYECDLLVESHSNNHLILHPCYMLGKWDSRPSSGAIIIATQLKKLNGYMDKSKNFVHARDVAKGIYQAIEKNAKGHYLLGGENIHLKDFMEKLFKKLNIQNSPTLLNESFLDNNPSFNDFFLTNPVDDSRARIEWGYTTHSTLDSMLDETITYFRENRLLPRLKSI